MTDHTNDDKPPSIAERYSSATHTSNLRVQAERGSPADILIAMGWSPSRVGAALMRLHSEFDGAEHPKKPTRSAVKLLASSLPRIQDGTRKENETVVQAGKKVVIEKIVPNMVLDMDAAHRQAHGWYMHELKILFGKLKTMPDVRFQLEMWARKQLIENAEHRVAEVLAWWLDHVCPACEGRAKELIPGTPHKSHKDCRVCRGTGETRIPHRPGNDNYLIDSKRLLKHIDVCVKTARTALKQNLPGMRLAKKVAEGLLPVPPGVVESKR